jgi:hypothetical protein
MTRSIHPKRSALVFGILLGGAHLFWALLVALGWAQPLINFIFWLHFIRPLYVIAPFDPGIALLLVGVTTAVGWLVGWCFAVLWNLLNRRS